MLVACLYYIWTDDVFPAGGNLYSTVQLFKITSSSLAHWGMGEKTQLEAFSAMSYHKIHLEKPAKLQQR